VKRVTGRHRYESSEALIMLRWGLACWITRARKFRATEVTSILEQPRICQVS